MITILTTKENNQVDISVLSEKAMDKIQTPIYNKNSASQKYKRIFFSKTLFVLERKRKRV